MEIFVYVQHSAFDEITNQQKKICRIIDHQQHLSQISIIHTISFQSLVHKEFRPELNDLDKLQWFTFVKIQIIFFIFNDHPKLSSFGFYDEMHTI